jgi:hypothetical protein
MIKIGGPSPGGEPEGPCRAIGRWFRVAAEDQSKSPLNGSSFHNLTFLLISAPCPASTCESCPTVYPSPIPMFLSALILAGPHPARRIAVALGSMNRQGCMYPGTIWFCPPRSDPTQYPAQLQLESRRLRFGHRVHRSRRTILQRDRP